MTIANALLADVNSEKGMTIVPRAPNKVEAYIAPADMIVSGQRINAGEYIKVTRGKEDAVTTVSPLSASLVATDLERTEGGTKSHYIDGNQPPIQLVFQTRSELSPDKATETPKKKLGWFRNIVISAVALGVVAPVYSKFVPPKIQAAVVRTSNDLFTKAIAVLYRKQIEQDTKAMNDAVKTVAVDDNRDETAHITGFGFKTNGRGGATMVNVTVVGNRETASLPVIDGPHRGDARIAEAKGFDTALFNAQLKAVQEYRKSHPGTSYNAALNALIASNDLPDGPQ